MVASGCMALATPARNDATEVVDDDFSTRLRNAAGSQAGAWSDEDAADDAESERQRGAWSQATPLRWCWGRVGGDYRRGGVDDNSQGTASPFLRSRENHPVSDGISATGAVEYHGPSRAASHRDLDTCPVRLRPDLRVPDCRRRVGAIRTTRMPKNVGGRWSVSLTKLAATRVNLFRSSIEIMKIPSFFGARETRRAIANASQPYPNCTFTGSVQ
jgi:hypothetical protein